MNVLVVSPHPDDEAIGCGGALRRHHDAGDEVHVVFLTSGEAGGHGTPPDIAAAAREAEAAVAAKRLGVAVSEFWRLPDGRLRANAALITRLAMTITRMQPGIVYTPHAREQHPDHRAAYRATVAAVRSLDADFDRPLVFAYEVWTPLGRVDHVVDVSPAMDAKVAAVRAYSTQLAVMRFDDAVEGLNRYRGEMHSWPGGDYAEVFERVRP